MGFKDGLIEALTQGIQQEKHIDHIWVIGSAEMMRDVAEATRPLGIPTTASLNTIMVDGFGICGSCRVLVDGKTRFACTDGPEFDAHLVDWDGLISRLAFYQRDEATPDHSSSHDCRHDNRSQKPAGRGID
jgi:ferredoxin--NADP+ reductase